MRPSGAAKVLTDHGPPASRRRADDRGRRTADRPSPDAGPKHTPRTGRGPFSAQLAEAVAALMFALSTTSRVRILAELHQGPRTVGELMDAVEMEQSAVSHQLRILREHGLVSAVRHGRQRVYALRDEHVAALLLEAVQHIADRSGALRRARRGAAT